MDGFVKLWRKSEDSAVFQDEKLWKLWSWLLIKANFKRGQLPDGTILEPGDLITSTVTISELLGCSRSYAHKLLKRLETLGNIRLNSEHNRTTVSLCNWGVYNDESQQRWTGSEQEVDKRWTGSEQEVNKQWTRGELKEEEIRRKKKNKEKIRRKEIRSLSFFAALDDDQFTAAVAAVREFEKYYNAEHGTFTAKRLNAAIERFEFKTVKQLQKAVTHSVAMNWKNIFPAPAKDDRGGAVPLTGHLADDRYQRAMREAGEINRQLKSGELGRKDKNKLLAKREQLAKLMSKLEQEEI